MSTRARGLLVASLAALFIACACGSVLLLGDLYADPGQQEPPHPMAPSTTYTTRLEPYGVWAARVAEEARLEAERLEAERVAAEEAARLELERINQSSRQMDSVYPSSGACGDDFECFKRCTLAHESDTAGGYQAVSPGGAYRGAWQFDQQTWDSNAENLGRPDLVGQDPASVAPGDQDAVAHQTWVNRGTQPWGSRC